MSVAQPARFILFGPFQLDLRAAELRRNGAKVRVPDQSIKVLTMLVQSSGEREDIMSTSDSVCCQQLSSDSPVRSLFGRILSLGFYDGTTSGCGSMFALFVSVPIRARGMGFGPRHEGLFTCLSAFWIVRCSGEPSIAIESPSWPFWSPILPPESAHDKSALSAAIDAELAKADPPTRVIASRHLDREMLASKELSSSARVKLPKSRDYPDTRDWDFWRTYMAIDSLPESTR